VSGPVELPSRESGVDRDVIRGSDYAELSRRIRQAGLLERRPRYYAVKMGVITAALAAGWTAFFVLGDSWYQLAVAAYLAVIFGQIGFLGHEAGHRQIFRSRRANDAAGLAAGDLLIGLYLGGAFAPNHKGMPVIGEQDRLDFLRRQVLTSRNVSGGRVVESVLGGLNYQIEHHLFPSMPRPCLRSCRAVVRAFCTQIGLRYCEKGIVSSYGDVLRYLHAVGADPAGAEPGVEESDTHGHYQ
jgi:fatty acid desaturase